MSINTKRVIPLLVFGMLVQVTLMGQNINYGIGIAQQSHFFQHSNQNQFEGTLYDPVNSYHLGIQAFLDWQTTDAFQLRILTGINARTIRFALQAPGTNSVQGHLGINYNTTSFRLLGRYTLKSQGWKFYPKLGLGFDWHAPSGVSTSTSGNGLIEGIPAELDDHSANATNVGMIAGCSIVPPFLLQKRKLELDIDFFLAPLDFLEAPILFEGGSNSFSVQGRSHYLSIALNYYLRKQP